MILDKVWYMDYTRILYTKFGKYQKTQILKVTKRNAVRTFIEKKKE